MANLFMRFPEGKVKVLTLSYDDGVEQDVRLIEIMKKYGLKGTFNINSGLYAPEGTVYPEGTIHRRMTKSQALALYKNSGMEIAVHGLTHPFLEQLPKEMCTYEVLKDRINLDKEYEVIVRGMAYPFGTHNDSVVDGLKQCGIVYSRTTKSTEGFWMPQDWLRLPATCHHNNPRLMELAEKFVQEKGNNGPRMFYLWGHSYEFDAHNNWEVIEQFAKYIGGREDIWYATNLEIYDYVKAYEQLIFSVIGKRVYNPTGRILYFSYDGKEYTIKPTETIQID